MNKKNKKKSQRKNMFHVNIWVWRFWSDMAHPSIHSSSEFVYSCYLRTVVEYTVDKWSVYCQVVFLDCGRKSEYTGRTCKLHTKGLGWNPTCKPLAVRRQRFLPSLFQMASMSLWSCLPGWHKIILAVHVCPTSALNLFLEHRSGMHCWACNLTTVNSILKSTACRVQWRCILK